MCTEQRRHGGHFPLACAGKDSAVLSLCIGSYANSVHFHGSSLMAALLHKTPIENGDKSGTGSRKKCIGSGNSSALIILNPFILDSTAIVQHSINTKGEFGCYCTIIYNSCHVAHGPKIALICADFVEKQCYSRLVSLYRLERQVSDPSMSQVFY